MLEDDESNETEIPEIGAGLAVVKVLLDHNDADVNAKSANGRTPLHFAAILGKSDFIQLLLDKNAGR